MKNFKKIIILFIFVISLFLTACGGGGGGTAIVPPVVTDTEVTSTSVSNNATNVSVSLSALQITFSKDMEAISTKAAFSITPTLAGTLNLSGKVLTFNIEENLKAGTTYTIIVATTAKDLEGVVLKTALNSNFRTEGASSEAPSAISNFSVESGDVFGNLNLNFSVPTPGTDTVSIYLVKYSTTSITESNFNDGNIVFSLPTAITIPIPSVAGTSEVINVQSSLLTEVYSGDKIYFAVKTQTINSYISNISNITSIEKPCFLTLKAIDNSDSNNLAVIQLGAQNSAVDGTDKFDTEAPPPPIGKLNMFTTLLGRSESLIVDTREHFQTNQGNSEVFHIIVNGNPNQVVKIEFPQFSSTTPLYDFKITGFTAEVTLTGQIIEGITLNGSGNKEFDLTVSN